MRERGATAVFVAAAMIALMGIAAIAIDYSAALNERRQDVGAADTAVLAGAVELGTTGALNPFQAVVDEIKAVADTNTPNPITLANWNACTDAEALAIPSTAAALGVTDGTACISFSADFSRVRVQLPPQATPTSFGRVVGIDQIVTAAAAEAKLKGSLGPTGGFPAGALSGTPPGSEFCMKASTPGQNNCDAFSTGNFADFAPYFYTDVDPGAASTVCVSGLAPAPLAWTMANGIDHRLGRTDVIRPPGTRVNGDSCPGTAGPMFPYQVDSGGGYSNQDITQGLVTGGSYAGGFSGRLNRGPYRDGTATIFGVNIDNYPLWAFIRPGGGLHADCVAARALPVHPGYTTPAEWDAAKDLMADCLSNETGLLFSPQIINSARITTIPLFHQAAPLPSNACCYDIKGGLPVFVESLWTTQSPPLACTGQILIDPVAGICRHDAGMPGSISAPPGARRVESASAFVLRASHLPGNVAQDLGGGSGSVFVNVELAR